MAKLGECVNINPIDFPLLAGFAQDRNVGLTVVGPEEPLARGIVDYFEHEGLKIFGPSRAAARLEASKAFAKAHMNRHGIPTAACAEFTDPDAAIAYIQRQTAPIVVKADGLAAGKGVTVAHDVDAAIAAVKDVLVARKFGEAGNSVIVEEFLEGEEASIFALTDGSQFLTLASSQDHKAAFDGDLGPNTGGMGAYSPAPVVTESLLRQVEEEVIAPCIEGMAADGHPYRGVLYVGLMITSSGPKVIEFNCRFGDPETQVVLPRMKSDLLPLLEACAAGDLGELQVEWLPGACVTVVMASGGYPEAYAKGFAIHGLDAAERVPGVTVFHAGTKQVDSAVVTNGGRVLNVTALGPDLPTSIDLAYNAVARIRFDGAHYRTDIGKKGLLRSIGPSST